MAQTQRSLTPMSPSAILASSSPGKTISCEGLKRGLLEIREYRSGISTGLDPTPSSPALTFPGQQAGTVNTGTRLDDEQLVSSAIAVMNELPNHVSAGRFGGLPANGAVVGSVSVSSAVATRAVTNELTTGTGKKNTDNKATVVGGVQDEESGKTAGVSSSSAIAEELVETTEGKKTSPVLARPWAVAENATSSLNSPVYAAYLPVFFGRFAEAVVSAFMGWIHGIAGSGAGTGFGEVVLLAAVLAVSVLGPVGQGVTAGNHVVNRSTLTDGVVSGWLKQLEARIVTLVKQYGSKQYRSVSSKIIDALKAVFGYAGSVAGRTTDESVPVSSEKHAGSVYTVVRRLYAEMKEVQLALYRGVVSSLLAQYVAYVVMVVRLYGSKKDRSVISKTIDVLRELLGGAEGVAAEDEGAPIEESSSRQVAGSIYTEVRGLYIEKMQEVRSALYRGLISGWLKQFEARVVTILKDRSSKWSIRSVLRSIVSTLKALVTPVAVANRVNEKAEVVPSNAGSAAVAVRINRSVKDSLMQVVELLKAWAVETVAGVSGSADVLDLVQKVSGKVSEGFWATVFGMLSRFMGWASNGVWSSNDVGYMAHEELGAVNSVSSSAVSVRGVIAGRIGKALAADNKEGRRGFGIVLSLPLVLFWLLSDAITSGMLAVGSWLGQVSSQDYAIAVWMTRVIEGILTILVVALDAAREIVKSVSAAIFGELSVDNTGRVTRKATDFDTEALGAKASDGSWFVLSGPIRSGSNKKFSVANNAEQKTSEPASPSNGNQVSIIQVIRVLLAYKRDRLSKAIRTAISEASRLGAELRIRLILNINKFVINPRAANIAVAVIMISILPTLTGIATAGVDMPGQGFVFNEVNTITTGGSTWYLSTLNSTIVYLIWNLSTWWKSPVANASLARLASGKVAGLSSISYLSTKAAFTAAMAYVARGLNYLATRNITTSISSSPRPLMTNLFRSIERARFALNNVAISARAKVEKGLASIAAKPAVEFKEEVVQANEVRVIRIVIKNLTSLWEYLYNFFLALLRLIGRFLNGLLSVEQFATLAGIRPTNVEGQGPLSLRMVEAIEAPASSPVGALVMSLSSPVTEKDYLKWLEKNQPAQGNDANLGSSPVGALVMSLSSPVTEKDYQDWLDHQQKSTNDSVLGSSPVGALTYGSSTPVSEAEYLADQLAKKVAVAPSSPIGSLTYSVSLPVKSDAVAAQPEDIAGQSKVSVSSSIKDRKALKEKVFEGKWELMWDIFGNSRAKKVRVQAGKIMPVAQTLWEKTVALGKKVGPALSNVGAGAVRTGKAVVERYQKNQGKTRVVVHLSAALLAGGVLGGLTGALVGGGAVAGVHTMIALIENFRATVAKLSAWAAEKTRRHPELVQGYSG